MEKLEKGAVNQQKGAQRILIKKKGTDKETQRTLQIHPMAKTPQFNHVPKYQKGDRNQGIPLVTQGTLLAIQEETSIARTTFGYLSRP